MTEWSVTEPSNTVTGPVADDPIARQEAISSLEAHIASTHPTTVTSTVRGGGTGYAAPTPTATKTVSGTSIVGGRHYVKGVEVSPEQYYNRPEMQRYVESRGASPGIIERYALYSKKRYAKRVGDVRYSSTDPRFGSQGIRTLSTGEKIDIATGQYLSGTGSGRDPRPWTAEIRKDVLTGRTTSVTRDASGRVVSRRVESYPDWRARLAHPPQKDVVRGPMTMVQKSILSREAAASLEAYYEKLDQGVDYRVFRGERAPKGFTIVESVPETTRTVATKEVGAMRYIITPGSVTTLKQVGMGGAFDYVSTAMPTGKEQYDVRAFVSQFKGRAVTVKPTKGGAIEVTEKVMGTDVSVKRGGGVAWVVARPETEGEHWFSHGKEMMARVEKLPGIAQLKQAETFISKDIAGAGDVYGEQWARTGKGPGVVVETGVKTVSSLVRGGAGVFRVPEFLAKTGVGAASMAHQAVVSPHSLARNVGLVTGFTAPAVAGAAVVAGSMVAADPRTLLYGGAYVLGAYATTSAAMYGGVKLAAAARMRTGTVGQSVVDIVSKQKVKGGKMVSAEYVGVGETTMPGARAHFTVGGMTDAFAKPSGFTPFSSVAKMRVKYVGLRGSKDLGSFRLSEVGVTAGVKSGSPIVSPRGVAAGYDFGIAKDLPIGVSAQGRVVSGGYRWVGFAKGAKETPSGTAMQYMKGAVTREVMDLGDEALYFSLGREVTRAGAKSTIKEFTLVRDMSKVSRYVPEGVGVVGQPSGVSGGVVAKMSRAELTGARAAAAQSAALMKQAATSKVTSLLVKEAAKDVTMLGAPIVGETLLVGALPDVKQRSMQVPVPASTTFSVSGDVSLPRTELFMGIGGRESIGERLVTPSVSATKVITGTSQMVSPIKLSAMADAQVLRTADVVSPVQVTGLASLTKQDTAQQTMLREVTRTASLLDLATTTGITTFTFTPGTPTTTTFPVVFPGFSVGGMGGMPGFGLVKRGVKEVRYTPSLAAVGLDILGKPIKGVLTGLEIRPVPNLRLGGLFGEF